MSNPSRLITIPENETTVIKQMDKGMDLLTCLWLTLQTRGELEHDDTEALSNLLFTALDLLKPVRQVLSQAAWRVPAMTLIRR